MNGRTVMELLLLDCENVQISSQQGFFTQCDGVTMGSSLGPFRVNIFLVLYLLQRIEKFTETSPVDKKEITNQIILMSLDMLTAAQKQKTREILNKAEASDVIDFNETGELTVNTNSTKFSLSTFSSTYRNQTET